MEVSVIIPVYNTASFVEKAVRSALMQEEVREVLVIDDGSTDGSLKIIRRLAMEDKRVRVFQHPGGVNKGPGASRNVGLRNVRYEFVAFLDADDYYIEERFKTTREVFQQHPDTEGVYECLKNIFETDEIKDKFLAQSDGLENISFNTVDTPPQKLFERLVLSGNEFISICALTVKRDFIRTQGLFFDESIRMAEELGFIFQCALDGRLLAGELEKPVVMRYVHSKNSIFNSSLLFKSNIVFYRTWFFKVLREQHSPAIVKFFLKNHLHYNQLTSPFLKVRLLRYIAKGAVLFIYLFRYPKLIGKFI